MKLATKVCKGLYFEFIGAKGVKFKVASLIKFELEVIIHKANPKTNLLQAINLFKKTAADDVFKSYATREYGLLK